MTERLNIVSVYCALDCIGDSIGDSTGDVESVDASKTDLHQKVRKNYINNLFDIAFEHIGQINRIILKTPDGAEIAYSGPPEDAMRMATDILNQISIANKQSATPLPVRIGIHLQPVQLVEDFNAQSNIVGSSINMAKQVAMHAKANHILVSRAYYENIPAETQAFATVFDDQAKQPETSVVSNQADSVDLKSVELDPVHLESDDLESNDSNSTSDLASSKSEDLDFIDAALEDLSVAESKMQFTENYIPATQQPITLEDLQPVEISKPENDNEWKYIIAISLILFIIIFAIKSTFAPTEIAPLKPTQPVNQEAKNPDVTTPVVTNPEVTNSEVTNEEALNPEAKIEETTNPETTEKLKPQPDNKNVEDQNVEPVRENTEPVVENKPVEKEVKQKPKEKTPQNAQKNNIQKLLKWETFKKSLKQGQKKECTQSEIALNQCKK